MGAVHVLFQCQPINTPDFVSHGNFLQTELVQRSNVRICQLLLEQVRFLIWKTGTGTFPYMNQKALRAQTKELVYFLPFFLILS